MISTRAVTVLAPEHWPGHWVQGAALGWSRRRRKGWDPPRNLTTSWSRPSRRPTRSALSGSATPAGSPALLRKWSTSCGLTPSSSVGRPIATAISLRDDFPSQHQRCVTLSVTGDRPVPRPRASLASPGTFRRSSAWIGSSGRRVLPGQEVHGEEESGMSGKPGDGVPMASEGSQPASRPAPPTAGAARGLRPSPRPPGACRATRRAARRARPRRKARRRIAVPARRTARDPAPTARRASGRCPMTSSGRP